ncbi:hypothetical protein F5X97DRAFT_292345 [Nemania serpens]|nr:hypothetical protein F5X97DRAFT_292345 [Nemania serpens]
MLMLMLMIMLIDSMRASRRLPLPFTTCEVRKSYLVGKPGVRRKGKCFFLKKRNAWVLGTLSSVCDQNHLVVEAINLARPMGARGNPRARPWLTKVCGHQASF